MRQMQDHRRSHGRCLVNAIVALAIFGGTIGVSLAIAFTFG
jgi:hypothetical protein